MPDDVPLLLILAGSVSVPIGSSVPRVIKSA